MKIHVRIVKELPDGSAECQVVYDKAGHKFMMQAGFDAIMEEAVGLRERKKNVRAILAAIPKEGRKANSKKIVGKTKSGKPTKGTRGNSRAPKILGRKGN
jgi:hypothetical protein